MPLNPSELQSASDPYSSAAPVRQQRNQQRIQGSLAIAAGALPLVFGMLGLIGLLTGVTITLDWILTILLGGLILSTLGGYLTALLAPQKPLLHGFVLMAGGGLLWPTVIFGIPDVLPWNLQLLTLATTLGGIGTGVWLQLRRKSAG